VFPKINPKEPKRYYDLVDILSEVEALKKDPMYSLPLSYFDTSEGILPIVHKFPYNVQEKWVNRAAMFKSSNHDLFPPFAFFVKFVDDLAKTRNDPALLCRPSNDKNVSNSTYGNSKVTCSKTEVSRPNDRKETKANCPIHNVGNHDLVDCRSFRSMREEREKILLKRSIFVSDD
jgi:hypothetical protein